MSDVNSAWELCDGTELSQGELVRACWVPLLTADTITKAETIVLENESRDLIVLTQSCDLDNGKENPVLLCDCNTVAELEDDPSYKTKQGWLKDVAAGRVGALHLLPGLSTRAEADPLKTKEQFVCDFRAIVALPRAYLDKHLSIVGSRHRLRSPYLEKFSQAFGIRCMRVATPN